MLRKTYACLKVPEAKSDVFENAAVQQSKPKQILIERHKTDAIQNPMKMTSWGFESWSPPPLFPVIMLS